MMTTESSATTVADLDAELRRHRVTSTSEVRAVRRTLSRRLRSAPATEVLRLAEQLVRRDNGFDRFVAYELINAHPAALDALDAKRLRKLGRGIDEWSDVDCFACYVSGVAWRNRRVPDTEILAWTRSADRWWRRAALVSTVPLNNAARGGSGDVARTLRVCRALLDDRDPMVVKALSWALRELSKRAPADVAAFVDRHGDEMPALARREVRNKLNTGLKSPRR